MIVIDQHALVDFPFCNVWGLVKHDVVKADITVKDTCFFDKTLMNYKYVSFPFESP
jgi:hypothetical protein